MNIIINIGRQIGSDGHDIGKLLAREFNAKFYDRELLNLAAKESGFSEKFFEQHDEKKGFFRELFNLQTPYVNSGSLYKSDLSQESLFQFQSDAIKKAAQEGNCVFMGRCADYVLRNEPQVTNIFITAPKRHRIDRVMAERNLDVPAANKYIVQAESSRAKYYNYYTGKKWGHASSYHLCIDSTVLGLEETARFIAEFIRKRLSHHEK